MPLGEPDQRGIVEGKVSHHPALEIIAARRRRNSRDAEGRDSFQDWIGIVGHDLPPRGGYCEQV